MYERFSPSGYYRTVRLICCQLSALLLSGCLMAGPDYIQPAAIMSPRFKEAKPAPGWTVASPMLAGFPKGEWWKIFNDPVLNSLEEQVAISNQNVKEYEAKYRNARALVMAAQANLYPTLTGTFSFARNGQGGSATSTSGTTYNAGSTRNTYAAEMSVDWEIDLWGKIRRGIEEQTAAAQASAADIENAKLSYQSQLAQDYFSLRYEESLKKLLERYATLYEQALKIVRTRHIGGTASGSDEWQARNQLEAARASATATDVARSQYEHAIAVLIGKAPADLTLARAGMPATIPNVPVTIPAVLLQRRPDIASAERTMAEYNAAIGVNIAAFYPQVSLSASYGYSGSPLQTLIRLSNRIWSLGASASETLFDGGARTAAVEEAQANYDGAVATYRQTVLSALQDTEDQLSGLRILREQGLQQDRAVYAAMKAVDISMNEYRYGTAIYTTVITSQQTAVSAQESVLQIKQNRLLATVKLIVDLGGGWDNKELPDATVLQQNSPFALPSMEGHT
ncbi:efflux transporter outer membrane subunit [Beijerinckia mobilis]|uniref:efflux transporter outer membrane subunit n=1 Tax=Beijerinckia mobilis TaxID=231434 RepID=UPI00068B7D36|nr:efflux transporter outer membrane subunit [Beijerinckia mobilis]